VVEINEETCPKAKKKTVLQQTAKPSNTSSSYLFSSQITQKNENRSKNKYTETIILY